MRKVIPELPRAVANVAVESQAESPYAGQKWRVTSYFHFFPPSPARGNRGSAFRKTGPGLKARRQPKRRSINLAFAKDFPKLIDRFFKYALELL